jgi:hypothetical protein
MTDSPAPARTLSRWGLYGPFLLFGLALAGWAGFWFFARGQVEAGLARFVEAEQARGVAWACTERSIGGFPFRLEVRCADITQVRQIDGVEARTSFGPTTIIGQPQTPGHIIIQAKGPAATRLADGRRVDLTWSQLEISRRVRQGALARFALEMSNPSLRLTDADGTVRAGAAASLSVQARQPQPADGAVASSGIDLAVTLDGVAAPDLDRLLNDVAPARLTARLAIAEGARLAALPTPRELEGWRLAGGRARVEELQLAKGQKRLNATGEIWVDDGRALAFRLEPSAANIDRLGAIPLGGAMDLLSGLSGRRQPAPDGLRPLPTLEWRDGRFAFGAITFRLQGRPLY